jgi:hypothetical protein
MQSSNLICSRCGRTAAPGTRYCANCGEAVDPALVAELRELYTLLTALSARVAAGQGAQTVAVLRDEVQARYLSLRTAPAGAPVAAAGAPGISTADPVVTPPLAPVPPIQAARPERPPRPAFSWRAFLSEQAIAIMAYLGAFLLLVATLAFELGGWQALSDGIKLTVVLVVYLVFGALGTGLRRVSDLRTVSSAYLGIFALMTPLVALAVYRFALSSSGFPVEGMICLGAAYAAIVYVALALRTEFSVYAYLGWVALGVAVVEGLVWARLGASLSLYFVALFALALLMPAQVRRWQVAARLGPAARHVAVLATAVAVGAGVPMGLSALDSALNVVNAVVAELARPPDGAVLLTSGALVALGVGWSAAVRASWPRWPGLAAASDIAVAALAALAALLLALQIGVTPSGMPGALALVALAALAVAVRYRRVAPALRAQRYGLEAIALALVVQGWLIPETSTGGDWPRIGVLTAGVIVAVGITLLEDAPWWLLLAGFFLTLDYGLVGRVLLPPSHLTDDSSPLYAALTVTVWLLALGLHRWERERRYALPVFAVALGDALFTSFLLQFNPSADTQTIILVIFLILAVAAAWLLQLRVAGGIVVGLFGVLASIPWIQAGGAASLKGAVMALALALAALAIRRALGRAWAVPLYVAGLWSVVLAVLAAVALDAVTAGWAVLDVPFATLLLLAVAVIASAIALAEGVPWATALPAALALWAVFTTGEHLVAGALPFVYAAVGVGLRRARGRWWGVAWYAAAFVASWLVLADLPSLGAWGATARAPLSLVLAAVAFAVARVERQPYATGVMALYLVYAAWQMPGPYEVALTIALTVGLVAAGFATSRWLDIHWAAGVYVAGALVSLFAVNRTYVVGTGQGEALLLIFAALAYVVAQLEREWRAGLVAVIYGAAAIFVRPDAHALLPLTLVCAALGVVAGRLGGIRLAYPLYAVAAVGGVITALNGAREPGFEAIALAVLAVVVYAIAVIESRPDALAAALLLGVLALGAAANALGLPSWQVVLAYAGLAWLYALGRYLWGALPGLRARGGAWWTDAIKDPERKAQLADPRALGIGVHRWASMVVGGGAVVGSMTAPDAFTPHASQTIVLGVALLSLAGLLAALGRETSFRLALYGAGGLVALAVTLAARWLGADNPQAFILAPGSYLLLCGALLPADEAVEHGERWGAGASLLGSLLLLAVTTTQSFRSDLDWVYAAALAVEALVIAGSGLGMRSRALIAVGSAFVVLAALRGAILALSTGVPVAAVLALASLLVLGAATWLSLRARRGDGASHNKAQP